MKHSQIDWIRERIATGEAAIKQALALQKLKRSRSQPIHVQWLIESIY